MSKNPPKNYYTVKQTAFLILSYLYKQWRDDVDLYVLRLDFNPNLIIQGNEQTKVIKQDLVYLSQDNTKKLKAALEYLYDHEFVEYKQVPQYHDVVILHSFKITTFGIEAVEDIENPHNLTKTENQFNFKVAENFTVNNSFISLDSLFSFLNGVINLLKNKK